MVFLIAIFALASASHVVELGDFNITEAINTHDYLLLEFYSPDCNHCRSLEPHYEKAAEALNASNVTVTLARILKGENWRAFDAFKVNSWPTLKFFDHGVASEYTGGKKYDEIYRWVVHRVMPYTVLKTEQELRDLIKNDATAFVLFGGGKERTDFFIELSKNFTGINFAVIDDEAARKAFKAEVDDYVLFKPLGNELLKYEGELDPEKATKFILKNSTPRLGEIDQQSLDSLVTFKIPTLLFFVPESDFGRAKDVLTAVSDIIHEDYWVRYGDLSTMPPLSTFFELSSADMPVGVFATPKTSSIIKYKYSGELSAVPILRLYSKIKEGTATPYYKSEEVPTTSVAQKVVRDSFATVVLDPTKHVLLAYYANYSPGWKQFYPELHNLIETYNVDGSDILIKKYDLDKNDPYETEEDFNLPTLKLYPKNNKAGIIYTGVLTGAAVEAFLKEHCTEQRQEL